MENSELHQLIRDTRRFLEQEKAWDGEVLATPNARETEKRRNGETVIQNDSSSRFSDSPHRSPVESTVGAAPTIYIHGRTGPVPRLSVSSTPKAAALAALYEKYKTCTRCPLGESRIKFVFGVGNPEAEVLFIGEGPGYEEDRRGEPFVGRAGQLLDKMLAAIGLSRQTVYIANIVKCHPMINPQTPDVHGNDRPPSPLEVETCSPILQQQIAIIRPRIIMTLGSPSTKTILQTTEGITKVRGRFFPLPPFKKPQQEETGLFENVGAPRDLPAGRQVRPDSESSGGSRTAPTMDSPDLSAIQVLPTYHPAALLRNPNLKPEAWEDLKLLRDTLKKPV